MRAELPKREPDRVRWWAERGTYERRLARNRSEGGKPYVLHDGPPYANNDLHMGTFLNRVLKDALVKIHLLERRVRGLRPRLGHARPADRARDAQAPRARFPVGRPARAAPRVPRARAVLDEPPARADAADGHVRTLRRPVHDDRAGVRGDDRRDARGSRRAEYLYKGLRSTLWCVHDETALAEAEIEYKDHVSPSIYVRFRANDAQRRAAAREVRARRRRYAALVRHLDDHAVDAARERRGGAAPGGDVRPLPHRH